MSRSCLIHSLGALFHSCAQLGMITLKEGTATRDRECVYATTKMAASSTASVIITTISSETIPTPRTGTVGMCCLHNHIFMEWHV